MRAPAEDLEQAAEEGIQIHNSCTMSAIRTKDGKTAGVDYFEVKECRFDEKGHLTLVPVEGGEHTLDCDTVIFAVGMKTALDFMAEAGVTLTPRNWIVVDGKQASSEEGILAAGDVASGPASIAAAIGNGRRAAFGVHAYLTGENSRVYAIGDVNGLTLLAHAADHQGAYVARRILGQEHGAYVPGPVPSCIYGSTEVMRVGQTAKALLAAGKAVSVSQAPLTLNPIAQAAGASGGFVKVVWDGDVIAGSAAGGHGVSHLVTVAQLLMVGGYVPEKLHEVMFGHPTLDEILPAAIRAPRVSVTEA